MFIIRPAAEGTATTPITSFGFLPSPSLNPYRLVGINQFQNDNHGLVFVTNSDESNIGRIGSSCGSLIMSQINKFENFKENADNVISNGGTSHSDMTANPSALKTWLFGLSATTSTDCATNQNTLVQTAPASFELWSGFYHLTNNKDHNPFDKDNGYNVRDGAVGATA